ncbi:MAG TPA: hypothetical protein VIM69_02850 [Opitutaceae bacterium]
MTAAFFDGETELAKRCGIEDIFAGTTTTDSRRERVRAACLERDPAIAWRGPTGKPETYGEAFARTYGEPL